MVQEWENQHGHHSGMLWDLPKAGLTPTITHLVSFYFWLSLKSRENLCLCHQPSCLPIQIPSWRKDCDGRKDILNKSNRWETNWFMPEFQERMDTAPRDAQGGIFGGSVQSQGLDSIPVGPSQFRIFRDLMLIQIPEAQHRQ